MNKSKKKPKKKENNNQICYIGIRSSDIKYCSEYFNSDICIFSNNEQDVFSIRPNQNIDNKEVFPYIANKINNLKNNKKEKFLFYNQANAYHYSKEIQKQALCINDEDLLNFLNNKLSTKKWFVENDIPVIPYETFIGEEVLYSILAKRFTNYDEFAIQKNFGGGGIGTYLLTKKNSNEVCLLISLLFEF